MAAPTISIVIPTFERLHFLRKAVASVRAQSFTDFECIVVDDGSMDGSAEYVTNLGDARFRLVRIPHSGSPAVARNAGLRSATGEWIAFLDSDDLWNPGKLAVQLEHVAGGDWGYTAWDKMDQDHRPLPAPPPDHPYSGRRLMDLLGVQGGIALPTVMARRSLLEQAGGFDESLPYCEDQDLWIRLHTVSPPVVVDAVLTRVRIHPGNYSRIDGVAVNRAWLRVFRKLASTSPSRAVRWECRKLMIRHRLALWRQLAGRLRRRVQGSRR